MENTGAWLWQAQVLLYVVGIRSQSEVDSMSTICHTPPIRSMPIVCSVQPTVAVWELFFLQRLSTA